MSTYGGGLNAPIIGAAALMAAEKLPDCCCVVLNNSTNCSNLGGTILQNGSCLLCESAHVINLAAQDPTALHVAGVMPVIAGGFMLTNTGVHMIRLAVMEIVNWWRKR